MRVELRGAFPRGSWRPLAAALILVLLLFAYTPLFRAGLLARDYAGLLGNGAGPLGTAWALASGKLFGLPGPGAGALGLRLELLAILLACAWAVRLLLARLLEPRLGAPAAERAALTAALLFSLHPRALLADADLAARADLVCLTLATWAAALFLSGRQRHSEALTTASPVLFLASGLVSQVGAPLVAIVAVAEFACVRRHRKRGLRLRTAATTAAVFGTAAGLPMLLSFGGGGSSAATQDGLAQAGRALMGLFLPLSGAGIWPSALAGIVLLTALWPAFRAARHAPRLWSGMLLVWCPGLFLALWFTVREGCELPAVSVW